MSSKYREYLPSDEDDPKTGLPVHIHKWRRLAKYDIKECVFCYEMQDIKPELPKKP